MKKFLLSAAILTALGASAGAQATGTILFDRDGAGASGAIPVDVFDWLPGNVLSIGAMSSPGYFQTVGQSKLSVFRGPGGSVVPVLANTEFTFQFSLFETSVGIGSATAAFFQAPGPSSFSLWYDTTPDANDITGTGYNDGTLILSGTISSLMGSYTDFTRLGSAFPVNPFPTTQLDNFGADNAVGITTHQGNGASTVGIDVTYADPNFFKLNITALIVDMLDNSNLATPFSQANPSDLVAGFAPAYSGGVNGADCPAEQPRCDFHFQADASSSFNVPEPASLALMGLGLGALGLSKRVRRKFNAA